MEGKALIVSPLGKASVILITEETQEYLIKKAVGGKPNILHLDDSLLMWFSAGSLEPISPLGTTFLRASGFNGPNPVNGDIVLTGSALSKGHTLPKGLTETQVDYLTNLAGSTCLCTCIHCPSRKRLGD